VGKQCTTNFQIIIVDDGNEEPVNSNAAKSQFKNVTDVVRSKESAGISGAFFESLPLCRHEYLLPAPGHNISSRKIIDNVLNLACRATMTIGCRNNLA
jgi:hypothetical protein